MRIQRLALVLTGVNLVILVLALVLVIRPEVTPDVSPVLRGRALEIIDSQGKVRAQVVIEPAATQAGQTYPETVLLRLINPDGGPGVKIGSSADGSGLLLSRNAETQQGWTGVQILSEEAGGLLRLLSKEGREQVIQP